MIIYGKGYFWRFSKLAVRTIMQGARQHVHRPTQIKNCIMSLPSSRFKSKL